MCNGSNLSFHNESQLDEYLSDNKKTNVSSIVFNNTVTVVACDGSYKYIIVNNNNIKSTNLQYNKCQKKTLLYFDKGEYQKYFNYVYWCQPRRGPAPGRIQGPRCRETRPR